MSLYLDHASTVPLLPEARRAMIDVLDEGTADPSRLYGEARRARILLDRARAEVADAIGGRPEEIVFTSGGTESCVLGIVGAARAAKAARKPARVAVTAVEHTAVLEAARSLRDLGFEVIELPVDANAALDLDVLREEAQRGLGLLSVQTANHEVGTLQPVGEAATIAKEAGAFIHTDACMTIGHLPTEVGSLGIDLLSASAHKFGGPPGAGFLWVRRGVRVRPLIVGDDRERGRRAGFENLPAIAGMAAGLTARMGILEQEAVRLRELAADLRAGLAARIEDVAVHADALRCLPGFVAFSVLYVEGEALLLGLDARGIAVHSGSSCTAASREPSHVLAAMGALTQGSIRVSMGADTTREDLAAFLDALEPVVEQARRTATLDAEALARAERER